MDGRNFFQKPPTVQFNFIQKKKFDSSGSIVDSEGRAVYRLVDRGDDHSMSWIKDYPLDIYRIHDNSLVGTIKWGFQAKKTKVEGLMGHKSMHVKGDLLDELFAFRMPDGSKFEWDGIWQKPWKLLDYRIPQPYSLCPAITAIYTPRSGDSNTTLEVARAALSTPGLLDFLVVTVIYLEYEHYERKSKKNLATVAGAVDAGGSAAAAASS